MRLCLENVSWDCHKKKNQPTGGVVVFGGVRVPGNRASNRIFYWGAGAVSGRHKNILTNARVTDIRTPWNLANRSEIYRIAPEI